VRAHRYSKLFGLAMAAVAQWACAADEQLLGRWCSRQVTMHPASGKTTTRKSSASQYMVQTFAKDRVVVEWARPPQSARWTQSYAVTAPGQLSMKMLEHSSLPVLIGSKSAYRYEIQGNALKLSTQPEEKQDLVVESIWIRCDEPRPAFRPEGTPNPVPYQ
jgi:hypothetical protein